MLIKNPGIFAICTIFLTIPLQNAIAAKHVIAARHATVTRVDNVNSNQYNVFVPNLASSNEFSVEALFLRPGGSNDYAVLVSPFNPNVPAPILSPSWETKGINPEYSTGVSVNFRHIFANSGTDINFNWGHLRSSDNDTFPVNRAAPPAQQFTGPIWNIGPDAGTTSGVTGQLTNNYDVFNVDFGKHVNLDPNLNSRFFAGVASVWLQQKTTANFTGTDPILGPYTFGITTKSKYSAGGFRFGMDSEYQTRYNISVLGMIAGDVYIGNQDPSTTTTGTGSILDAAGMPVNNQSISHKSYVEVIPALDTKLGVKYSQKYLDALLSVEVGYMASVYVNAIQNYVPSTYVPGSLGIVSGSVFLQSLLKSTHSFSVDGPFLKFTAKL